MAYLDESPSDSERRIGVSQLLMLLGPPVPVPRVTEAPVIVKLNGNELATEPAYRQEAVGFRTAIARRGESTQRAGRGTFGDGPIGDS